jgi:hypothetical protein
VVEDRQRERLQQDRLSERRADGEHRRPGEVEVALGVAVDVAGEAEAGQVVEQAGVVDALRPEGRELGLAEPEVGQGVEEAAGAGEHPVAAPVRQPAGEDLEHAVPVGRAVGQRGGQHGQLVAVGQQRGAELALRHGPAR